VRLGNYGFPDPRVEWISGLQYVAVASGSNIIAFGIPSSQTLTNGTMTLAQ
jgi:hypothetical protein